VNDGAAMVQHLLPSGREVDLLSKLFEQGNARMLFEMLDLRGDRWWRQIQLVRRPGKTQAACDGFESLELTQSGILHSDLQKVESFTGQPAIRTHICKRRKQRHASTVRIVDAAGYASANPVALKRL
jgi:hypothetical protein